jgi:hypothetical protein
VWKALLHVSKETSISLHMNCVLLKKRTRDSLIFKDASMTTVWDSGPLQIDVLTDKIVIRLELW